MVTIQDTNIKKLRAGNTRSSAIAEGLRDALVSRNLTSTKQTSHSKKNWDLQSSNDLEVRAPKVMSIAAFILAVYHFLLVASCCYNISV